MDQSQRARTKAQILKLLTSPKYRPLDKVELGKALNFKSDDRAELKDVLRELENSGEIARIRKNRYVLPKAADLVTGTLQGNQAGYGFVVNEAAGQPDLFIPAENTWTAMHGDRVVARMVRDATYMRGSGKSGRSEGMVIRILQRAHETLVGTLQQSKNFLYVVPDDPRLVHNVYVAPLSPNAPKRASLGDKVVVKLEPWESRHVNPEGEIVEVLGRATDPGVDMLSIVRKHNLPTEFPPEVLRQAEEIPETVQPDAIAGREDLRGQFIITIDPDDARDFDDAIHVEQLAGGGWQLGVHIADVAHYVQPGSALDREALRRGNSVYLADRVIPMLPERLSNGVCSLKPEVDRLTHSVFIDFTREGKIKSARFARTVIRSARRFTYKQAYAALQARPNDEASERLHTAWGLASLLRRRRFEHGSLDLDFPEVKVYLDENGKPVRLERVENDESHQLIEEFMLAANEVVAHELKNRLVPAIYRVHEDPDPEKLAEYREFAHSHGYKVGDLKQRAELQRLLASTRGRPEEQAMKIGLLKSLKRARYAPQSVGHYGLNKSDYTHFTSPIRRYADLVVHRVLASLSDRRAPRADAALVASISEHISVTERVAQEAENESVKLKKLEFFQLQLTEGTPQIFKAVIVDVRNYGLLIELPEFLLTGLVHVTSIADDFYAFDTVRRRLVGRQSKRKFALGDEVRVVVDRVDIFKRQVDFKIAPEPGKTGSGRRR